MVEQIFTWLTGALSGNFVIALAASMGWGVLSILLSPCHLSSIPLIVGYISSQGEASYKRAFSISLVFAAGILLTIAVIGFVTVSIGRLMGDIGSAGNYIVAVVFLVIGLYLLDIIKLPWNSININPLGKKGLLAALIIGLIFGLGLGPCTFAYMAPILGVVFQVSRTNLLYSILLLLSFAAGHCFVIVLAGTVTNKVQHYLNWNENTNAISILRKTCGVFVLSGGFYFVYTTLI
jgi:cytochrome c-type biogenesis protein